MVHSAIYNTDKYHNQYSIFRSLYPALIPSPPKLLFIMIRPSLSSILTAVVLLVLSSSWNGIVRSVAFNQVRPSPSPRTRRHRHHPPSLLDKQYLPITIVVDMLYECRTRMNMVSGDDNMKTNNVEKIRYLGAGDDAIIRPGVVLVAPVHEYDHFLMRSAVFIHAIGIDEQDNVIIRGVVIDHPTAFTIGEMSPNVMGKLSDNLLFRGGYDGSDTAMMLHSAGGMGGPIKSDTMIGSSGIFEGGIVSAMESVDAGVIDPDRCKFFFNYMQFSQKELDNMFGGVEDGDTWVSLEIPADYVLNSDYERGQLWSKLRNVIRDIRKCDDPSK